MCMVLGHEHTCTNTSPGLGVGFSVSPRYRLLMGPFPSLTRIAFILRYCLEC